MSERARDPLLHMVLGGYMLRECLGTGGSARVYRGESTTQKRIVRAIKVIHWEQTRRLGCRFIEEARLLEELAHPNVVKFHHATEDQGYLVMVLELLRGQTLRAFIDTWRRENEPAPLARVLDILIQASEGIAFAHAFRKGVVHRDIKPENLFVTTDGVTKVLDFGIARALDDAEREAATTTGVNPMGTAPYMAPELWHGEELPSPATDVYSLGITLFEALTGRHPFEHPEKPKRNAPAMMNAHLTKTIPSLREFRPDAPEALEKVVEKAMAKESGNRCKSAAEFGEALREVRKELVVPEKPPALEPEPEPERIEPVVQSEPDPSTLAITEMSVQKGKSKVSPGVLEPTSTPMPETSTSWRKSLVGGFVAAAIVSGIVWQKMHPEEPARAATNAPSAAVPAPSASVVQTVASASILGPSCPDGMVSNGASCVDIQAVTLVQYAGCVSCPLKPTKSGCTENAYQLSGGNLCIPFSAAKLYCESMSKSVLQVRIATEHGQSQPLFCAKY